MCLHVTTLPDLNEIESGDVNCIKLTNTDGKFEYSFVDNRKFRRASTRLLFRKVAYISHGVPWFVSIRTSVHANNYEYVEDQSVFHEFCRLRHQ
jgi:hypothetical protein